MDKDLGEVEFTIFDTETTGLEPQSGDRIVEIAAVRLKGSQNLATFQSLVDPKREISEAAFSVNGITRQMLEGAPEINAVLPKFLEFIRGSCLCSYNAIFDLEFLNNELKVMGEPALSGILVVDILKMARRLLPGLERYALWSVAEKLGVKMKQLHRALEDVELTIEVFHKFREILKLKGISSFTEFSGLFSVNQDILASFHNQKTSQIQEAINLGVGLKIKYLSSSGAEYSEREVIPKEIRQENGRYYLTGYCCLKNAERTFRIDNILHLEILQSKKP
jgi:DNA polymerase-3 subunit alpha (Gram-positive type)